MSARWMSLLIWAAVLAGAVAWGLPLFTRATPVPAGAGLAAASPPAGAGLARLLGQAPVAQVADQAPVVADSRFQLVGVVAPRQAGARGLALIAVDGKPARAVGVGRELEPGLRLLSVGHRQVELGAAAGAPAITLTLPALAEAQRGRPGEGQAGLMAGQMAGQMGGQPTGLPPVLMPRVMPGMVPSMRVPPLSNGQPQQLPPVQVPQGMPQGQIENPPGALPYQPDVNGNPMVGEQPPPATSPRFR